MVERNVELFAALHFVLVGLSHAFQPRAWAEFFIWLHQRGRAGVFVHGFLSLGFGSVIVAFHPVWSGWPLVLTLVGYVYMVKAGVCFLLPGLGLRSLARVSRERPWEFVVPGVLFVAVGVLSFAAWAGLAR